MRDYAKEFEDLFQIAMELLGTLNSKTEWSEEEDLKLKRADKIAALILKTKNAVGDPKGEAVSVDEDDKIIANFLERAGKD